MKGMNMQKMNKLMLALGVSVIAIAFENKSGWKLDADGKVEMKDGNPVYIDASGNEMVVEGGTISRLNGEAKQHREAKEAALSQLDKFKVDGKLIDVEAARKALETVANIDAKKLIDAGKVDEVKQQITAQFQTQLDEREKAINGLSGKVNGMTLDKAFSSSKFITENVAVPSDMFRKAFGDNFKVEDGKVIPYGSDGNPIYSKTRHGEIADFDEGIEHIVSTYPNRDAILKAKGGSGSGAGGNGGQRGQGRYMKRSEFDALAQGEKAQVGAQMAKGEVTIVD